MEKLLCTKSITLFSHEVPLQKGDITIDYNYNNFNLCDQRTKTDSTDERSSSGENKYHPPTHTQIFAVIGTLKYKIMQMFIFNINVTIFQLQGRVSAKPCRRGNSERNSLECFATTGVVGTTPSSNTHTTQRHYAGVRKHKRKRETPT